MLPSCGWAIICLKTLRGGKKVFQWNEDTKDKACCFTIVFSLISGRFIASNLELTYLFRYMLVIAVKSYHKFKWMLPDVVKFCAYYVGLYLGSLYLPISYSPVEKQHEATVLHAWKAAHAWTDHFLLCVCVCEPHLINCIHYCKESLVSGLRFNSCKLWCGVCWACQHT